MSIQICLSDPPRRPVGRAVSLTCGAGGIVVPPPDVLPTVSLTATPASVSYLGSSTLTWTSTDATSLVASGHWGGNRMIPSGSTVRTDLTSARHYVITATNAEGSVVGTADVAVGAPPLPTVTLDAAPTDVAYNGSTTLTWATTTGTSCVASGDWSGTKALAGSEVRTALTSNKNYILTVTGPGGAANDSAAVTVAPADVPTVTLTATPPRVVLGGSSTLSWSSTDATTLTASGDWSGSKAVPSGSEVQSALTVNKTYTLTATGPGGSAEDSASVAVDFMVVGAVEPTLIPLIAATQAIDLDLRDSDIYLQFGAANVLEVFDPATAKYHARTYEETDIANFPGFGVAPIGVPPGSTHMAALAVQSGGASLSRRIVTDFEGYGGTPQLQTATSTVAATNCILRRALATPIPVGASVSGVFVCARAANVTSNFLTLSPAAASGTLVHPRIAIGCNLAAGNTAICTVTNAAGTGTATPAQLGWADNTRTLLGFCYDVDADTITLYRYNGNHGFESDVTVLAVSVDLPLTHLHVGGNNAGASVWAGARGPIRIMLGKMTEFQFLAHYGPNAPWWPLLDDLVDVAFVPWVEKYRLREWVSGGDLEVQAGAIGNMTQADMTGEMTMGLLNCLDVQSASTVKNWPYNNLDQAADRSLGAAKSAVYDAQAHHAGKYDAGATADADNADATTTPAGEFLVGQGAGQVIDFKNASGVATDVGSLNTCALTRSRAYGEKEWFGLGKAGGVGDANSVWQDAEYARNTINGKTMCCQIIGLGNDTSRAAFGYVDNLTGRWEDETLGGDVYAVAATGTTDGYGGGAYNSVGKAWHWGCNSSGIHGYGISSEASLNETNDWANLCKWTLVWNGTTGHLVSSTRSVISVDLPHNTPLAAWAPSRAATAVVFGGGSGGINYVVEGSTTNRNVGPSIPGLTSYRMVGQAEAVRLDPLQETTIVLAPSLTNDANYGQIISQDWTTHVKTIVTAVAGLGPYTGDNTGTGANILFDPCAIYSHEYGGLIYIAFTNRREEVTFFDPDGEEFLSVPVIDLWQGPIVGNGAGGGSLYAQSTEQLLVPLPGGGFKYGCLFSILDQAVADPGIGNVSSANSVQIWVVYTDGTSERMDAGASDGSVRIRHEGEVMYTDPDPLTGMCEMLVQYNEFYGPAPGISGMIRPMMCKTGRFFPA